MLFEEKTQICELKFCRDYRNLGRERKFDATTKV